MIPEEIVILVSILSKFPKDIPFVTKSLIDIKFEYILRNLEDMDVREALKLYHALSIQFGKENLHKDFVAEMDAYLESLIINSHNSLQSDCLPYLLPLYPLTETTLDQQDNI